MVLVAVVGYAAIGALDIGWFATQFTLVFDTLWISQRRNKRHPLSVWEEQEKEKGGKEKR
jgi:hypothetical protein